VQIYTGRPGSPYNSFAHVLRDRLKNSRYHWDVEVVATNGSVENIYNIEKKDARKCRLALAQLNTTVDATAGVHQFAPGLGGHAVQGLRTIGPAHNDLLHVIVRDDSDIHEVADLCNRHIAPGPENSGTRQISDVLLRVGLPPECQPETGGAPIADGSAIDEGLRRLSAGIVDAVFWSGGAGTSQIKDAIEHGAKLRLLDLERYREGVIKDWDNFYSGRGGKFFPGIVFTAEHAGPDDYPGLANRERVETIGIPNGVLAHEDADQALVQQTTIELFTRRDEFETALWGENKGHRAIPDALSIYESPMFCYIPIHFGAQLYYINKFGRMPSCAGT
jgi:TRAP transporter TAXI family solute receptor